MKTAYEQGLMRIAKVPYDRIGECGQCHVKSCDTCHAQEKDGKASYSTAMAKDPNTCLKCHGKEGLTMMLGKEMGKPDIHIGKGMVCVDCHKGKDVLGEAKSIHRCGSRAPYRLRASPAMRKSIAASRRTQSTDRSLPATHATSLSDSPA